MTVLGKKKNVRKLAYSLSKLIQTHVGTNINMPHPILQCLLDNKMAYLKNPLVIINVSHIINPYYIILIAKSQSKYLMGIALQSSIVWIDAPSFH